MLLVTSPILYLAFNRIESVKRTFPEIRKAQPAQLFVGCDGPRDNEEQKKTDEVRKYILEHIDWDCDVKTLFRDDNLGCKYAVSGAIDWFFHHVEEGIILEDDCLPDQSFFRFCDEMLEKYRDEDMVMNVAGENMLAEFKADDSYIFSKYFYCWGWATWRDSWEKMDLEMDNYVDKDKHLYSGIIERTLWEKRFNDNIARVINSWATSFFFSQMYHKKLCVVPKCNLVENIGFLESATHTKENKYDSKYLHHLRNEIEFPLIHPNKIIQNKKFDREFVRQDLKRVILKNLSYFK